MVAVTEAAIALDAVGCRRDHRAITRVARLSATKPSGVQTYYTLFGSCAMRLRDLDGHAAGLLGYVLNLSVTVLQSFDFKMQCQDGFQVTPRSLYQLFIVLFTN